MMMADGSLAFCPGAPLGGGAGGGAVEGGGPGTEAGEAGAEEAKKGTTQEGLMRGLVRAPVNPHRRPGGGPRAAQSPLSLVPPPRRPARTACPSGALPPPLPPHRTTPLPSPPSKADRPLGHRR